MDFLYVGDPLCSWCWGFAPSIRQLRDELSTEFRYQLVVGGLRTGPQSPRLGELRSYLSQAWHEVARRSGQPFDYEQLRTADFVYDTEPACRAVVAARSQEPDAVFDYHEALQRAFYHAGQDPTSADTFVSVARQQGLDELTFRSRFESQDVADATQADFETTHAMGVTGFPTTLVRIDGRLHVVSTGFVEPEELVLRVKGWSE